MHPSDPTWRAYLDDEVEADRVVELGQHLKGCETCQHAVRALLNDKTTVADLLGSLEVPVPAASINDVFQRAKRPSSRRWALIAAMILLGIVTVAGATIATGAFQSVVGRLHRSSPPDLQEQSQTPTDSPALTGISLETTGTAEIVFLSAQGRGTLTIVESDQPRVDIVATTPVPYTVRSGRVTIANAGTSADYQITFPRTLHRAEVRVVNRVLFSRQSSVVRALVKPDSAGKYVLMFVSFSN